MILVSSVNTTKSLGFAGPWENTFCVRYKQFELKLVYYKQFELKMYLKIHKPMLGVVSCLNKDLE